MYKLIPTHTFSRLAKKSASRNKPLKEKILNTLEILSSNPLYPSLHSHKVETKQHGVRWSSSVTGDIRIIWDYSEVEKNAIDLLDIGGHSGKRKVYK